jgi:hypothetical protein
VSEVIVDTITDDEGDQVELSVDGDGVFVTLYSSTGCVHLNAERQERFAQAYVAACHQAKVNAAQSRPADGMNAVERAARDLIGIPDNL